MWLLKVFKLLYILRIKIRHLKSFNLFFPSCFSIKKFVRQLNFSLSREINKNSEKTTKRKNLISHLRNLKLDSRHFFLALSSCKLNFYLFRNFESLFFCLQRSRWALSSAVSGKRSRLETHLEEWENWARKLLQKCWFKERKKKKKAELQLRVNEKNLNCFVNNLSNFTSVSEI